jgi:cytochrome c peroxidase
MARTYFILISLAWLCSTVACRKEPGTAQVDPPFSDTTTKAPTPYILNRPPGFPPPVSSVNNPLTVEGIELGRNLYSDPILSSNGLSCSSCHQRQISYSRPVFNTQNGFRISVPPHVNLAFKTRYNWEGSESDLDTLCMGDFEPEFFNTQAIDLYERLSSHPVYPTLFRKAFGIKDLRSLSYYKLKVQICYAISQYMRTLVSAGSRFDSLRFGGQLDYDEHQGMLIFLSEKGDCYHCHSIPLFSDGDLHNNGLNDVFEGFDKGHALVSGKSSDHGRFVTPTLRNIALTAPYMHDGRFQTLEEVVEFYNSGVKPSATLDPIMHKRKNLQALDLSLLEKQQLVAFLHTLTDKNFVK